MKKVPWLVKVDFPVKAGKRTVINVDDNFCPGFYGVYAGALVALGVCFLNYPEVENDSKKEMDGGRRFDSRDVVWM